MRRDLDLILVALMSLAGLAALWWILPHLAA